VDNASALRKISGPVAKAIRADDAQERADALHLIAEELFASAFDDIDTGELPADLQETVNTFSRAIVGAIDQTTDESDPERVAQWIATAALNAATLASAPSDANFTWRTQQDDRVREMHVPMHGVTVAAGQPFIVGGYPLQYPGQPVGPPDVWINCRCFLDVNAGLQSAAEIESAAPDSLVAREFNTEQRKKLASKGQAMPDGSYPIANEEDLRNAIQAIGRAKDPAAVKRHIRKRARALGLTDLIPDSWTASGEEQDELAADASDSLVAVDTHDAPGWITNPRETQRLRTYWTRGKGAAKIGWGAPGDFNRCRRQLRKYIHNPAYLDGTCANMHYVALGFWPNQGPHAGKRGRGRRGLRSDAAPITDLDLDTAEAEAVTAAFEEAAQLGDGMDTLPPMDWFDDPGLTGPTPLTIAGDGQVFGHLATWGTCHVGIDKTCVTAPKSTHDYAYFRTGEVETAGGPVSVGQLTMNTGHATDDLDPNETVRHYDHTGTAIADVAAGEDDYGIWVAGAIRPGVTLDQIHGLRAGALSGDWRRIGGNLELVGALVVNVPGFPIPRPSMAASGDLVLSLTAAAVVSVDPNANYERLALVVEKGVTAALDQRERRRRASALTDALRAERARRLLETVR
jgi:hypothetical protein